VSHYWKFDWKNIWTLCHKTWAVQFLNDHSQKDWIWNRKEIQSLFDKRKICLNDEHIYVIYSLICWNSYSIGWVTKCEKWGEGSNFLYDRIALMVVQMYILDKLDQFKAVNCQTDSKTFELLIKKLCQKFYSFSRSLVSWMLFSLSHII